MLRIKILQECSPGSVTLPISSAVLCNFIAFLFAKQYLIPYIWNMINSYFLLKYFSLSVMCKICVQPFVIYVNPNDTYNVNVLIASILLKRQGFYFVWLFAMVYNIFLTFYKFTLVVVCKNVLFVLLQLYVCHFFSILLSFWNCIFLFEYKCNLIH